jgi:hypothetical protein
MKTSSGQATRVMAMVVVFALPVLLAFVSAIAPIATGAQGGRADVAGGMLRPGARLTYGSAAGEQPAWTIDSVHQGVSLGDRAGCTRIYLRMRPNQQLPTERVLCRGGDTLHAWNATTSAWRADRPLGAGMRLSVPQPSGAVLDYETSAQGDTMISGHRLAFVRTVITTRDAQGRATRRLTERYALGLATALGGVFETPDSASAGAWRESQRFELVRVEIP